MAAEAVDPGPRSSVRRRILDRPVLPSPRAIVGGLLLALSGVGTFVAWQQAAGVPNQSYVVARHAIPPGERVRAEDLRLAPLELPGGVAAGAFDALDGVVGRVALAPIGPDELVQTSQLSTARSAEPGVELAFALPRDRAIDGQLLSGDRVDVFVTYPDYTAAVAEGVQVVSISDGAGRSLSSGSEITVTLALGADGGHAELIHALRAGEVTLVRSTHAGSPAAAADADPADREVFRPSPPPGAGL